MWLAALCSVAALAMGLLAAPAAAARSLDPRGTWLTANGHGVVEIDRCGDALCGRIVGIERGPADPIPTDVHGQPQCGLTIITGEKPEADGSWLGQVIDPRDGGRYQAKLWLDQKGNLKLRGFIGIPALGATQTWQRFTGRLAKECRVA